MGAGVFLIGEGGELLELVSQRYDSENFLQELLARYPSLLAGDQIDPEAPRQWLLIEREAAVPSEQDGAGRWSVDHLFLDQDAIPTLVEVKRSTDTRIRREVVGQMLDYAANAMAFWPVETLRAAFEARCTQASLDPDNEMQDFLGPNGSAEQFWQTVKTNLQAGRIRLVFVADEIPAELRRIVEFLNQQMDPAEVLAVEIRQYVGGNLRSLIPRVMGQTEQAKQRKAAAAPSPRLWDEGSFFAELQARQDPQDAMVARQIADWAKCNGARITFGKGRREGSLTPAFDHNGLPTWPVTLWTYGKVEILFQWLASSAAFRSIEK